MTTRFRFDATLTSDLFAARRRFRQGQFLRLFRRRQYVHGHTRLFTPCRAPKPGGGGGAYGADGLARWTIGLARTALRHRRGDSLRFRLDIGLVPGMAGFIEPHASWRRHVCGPGWGDLSQQNGRGRVGTEWVRTVRN